MFVRDSSQNVIIFELMLHYHEVTVPVVRCFAMEMLLLLFLKTEKCKYIVELNSLRSGSLVKKLCNMKEKLIILPKKQTVSGFQSE